MRCKRLAAVLSVVLVGGMVLSACTKKDAGEKRPEGLTGDLMITQTLMPSDTPFLDIYGAVETPTTIYAGASTDAVHFADQVIAAPIDDLKLANADVLYTSAFAETVDEEGSKTGAWIYSLVTLDDGRIAFIDSDMSGESEPLVILGDPQTKTFAPLELNDVDTYYLDRLVARGNTLYFLAGQPMTEDEEAQLDEDNPQPLDAVDKANLMAYDTATGNLAVLHTGDKSSLKLFDLDGALYWLGYEAAAPNKDSTDSTPVTNVLYSYDTETKKVSDIARFDGAVAEPVGAGDGRVVVLEQREIAVAGDDEDAYTIEQIWHVWDQGDKDFHDITPEVPGADGWGDVELAQNLMVYYSDAGMGDTSDNYGFSLYDFVSKETTTLALTSADSGLPLQPSTALFRDAGQTLVVYTQALSETTSTAQPEEGEMMIDEEGNLVPFEGGGTELVPTGSTVSEYKLLRQEK